MYKSSCAGRLKTKSFKIDLGLIAEYVGSDIFAEQKLCCDAAIKDHCIIQSSTFPTGAHPPAKKYRGPDIFYVFIGSNSKLDTLRPCSKANKDFKWVTVPCVLQSCNIYL